MAKTKAKSVIITALICVAIIAAAFGGARVLTLLKPAPRAAVQVSKGPRVEVLIAQPQTVSATVHRNGQVEPRTQIDLVPQVSGRVVRLSDNLIDGGTFKRGELLIEIDPTDYKLARTRAEAALQQAQGMMKLRQADIASARSVLEQELASAEIAVGEWRRERPGTEPPPLVARRPQVDAARATLESALAQLQSARAEVLAAEVNLEQAELDLQRTKIEAPFNGRVMSESVDNGQFVVTGSPLAKLYATDVAQIVVPIEDRQLRWFDPPGNGAANETRVTVTGASHGVEHTWTGRVARTSGQIDPRSRMVHLIIEVTNPQGETGAPLVPGMFVDVAITGRDVAGIYRVPRHAVHRHETTLAPRVWVADRGRLTERPVEVARFVNDEAWVTEGLNPGDAVVITTLEAPVPGMAIRTDGEPTGPIDPTHAVQE